MRTYTDVQVNKLNVHRGDVSTDNDGQVIIYTNIFMWADGTYHDVSEGD